jgi:hypothetical protein
MKMLDRYTKFPVTHPSRQMSLVYRVMRIALYMLFPTCARSCMNAAVDLNGSMDIVLRNDYDSP